MSNLYHPVQIGNLKLNGNIFLAPMADYSDASYRSVCYECGVDFTYTELISSEALVRDNRKTFDMIGRAANESAYAVQIFGSDSKVMADAARVVLARTDCDCIDINCGCPVPKVTKTGAGSVLTREPEKLYSITKAVIEAVEGKVPVTVKIRKGWDNNHITYKECGQAALDAGAAAIAIHGRTTAQGYGGEADWNAIKDLVDFIGGRIPVIGNGDVRTPEDAERMLKETGCDAIMIGRAAQGNPFIFTKVREYLVSGKVSEISLSKSLEMGFKELELLKSAVGEKAACMKMRGRFSNYVRGIDGAKEVRLKIIQCSTTEEFKQTLADYL